MKDRLGQAVQPSQALARDDRDDDVDRTEEKRREMLVSPQAGSRAAAVRIVVERRGTLTES